VEQVLKASEVRQRSTRKNWTEVDFAKLVGESVEVARTRHRLKPEELYLENAPGDEILVRGNSEELRTLVLNLFDNAVKYSDEQKRHRRGNQDADARHDFAERSRQRHGNSQGRIEADFPALLPRAV